MQPSPPVDGKWRRPTAFALLLTLVVVTAGCADLGGAGGAPSPAPTTTTTPVQTTTDSHSNGHSHSHTTERPTTATTEPGSTNQADAATGEMTVVVAGEEVTDGATFDSDRIRFDADEPHTWHANGDVTLAEALESLGVEVEEETLTYEGTTYDDAASGTSVNVRVNGDPVEPSRYVLADGDQVWVTVETPDMDVSTPGEYIDNEDQHVHGHMAVTVNGEEVDFSRGRYQSNDRYFHYEGGDGAAWHAHSYTITLEYALSSLDGIDVNADGTVLTYDGTTYRAEEPGTTITIEVNGQPVEPGEYYLKDWDGVRVVIDDGG